MTKQLIMVLAVLSFVSSPITASAHIPVKVGSKAFTEQIILGKIMVSLLKAHNIPVEDRTCLGSTQDNRDALKNGKIDLYMEYTGTAWCNFFHKKEAVRDAQELYQKVKAADIPNGLVWLSPCLLNNTYCLVMQDSFVEKTGTATLSLWADWVRQNPGQMTVAVGSDVEFYTRPDGFVGMMAFYGLKFGNEITASNVMEMKIPMCKKAVHNGLALCGMAFATDAQTLSYNLTVLKDDKNFFPIYNPAPVIRAKTLDLYPELKSILDKIGALLDTKTITQLNYQVDVKKESPEQVAENWLGTTGLTTSTGN